MNAFDHPRFNVTGKAQIKSENINVTPAMPNEKVLENIKINLKRGLPSVTDNSYWRGTVPCAVVGGGPSLKTQLELLKTYKYILACGSVHDYLITNNVIPTWAAICDPDGPIMNSYLTKIQPDVHYFIASQCDPSTFELINKYKNKHSLKYVPQVTMWHLAGDKFDNNAYGSGAVVIGGGCTIGTRGMVLAMGMGFYNLHLFGFDNCLSYRRKSDLSDSAQSNTQHHAYEFVRPDLEEQSIKDVHELQFEVDGPIFKVAGYHLAQFFEIKEILKQYAHLLNLEVFGEGMLKYVFDVCKQRKSELNLDQLKELKYGNGN